MVAPNSLALWMQAYAAVIGKKNECTRTLTIRPPDGPPTGGVHWTRCGSKDSIKTVKDGASLCFSVGCTHEQRTTTTAPVAAGKFARGVRADAARDLADDETWTDNQRIRQKLVHVSRCNRLPCSFYTLYRLPVCARRLHMR